MPAFAEMFGYTPTEYRALSFADWWSLRRYIDQKAKADDRANRRREG
jgi:hypothetical protein